MAAVMILEARDRCIEFPRRPLVMGIVNINDDSFCGDGTLDISAALAQADAAIRDGADVIDIGAESARTNRGPISEDEEVARLIPFLKAWLALTAKSSPADDAQVWPPLLSINTWRSAVIERVLPHGGDLLNDISALPDATHAKLCAQHGAALLIMHSVGQPKEPHTHVSYPDVMETLGAFFDNKIQLALDAGLRSEQIVIDPGIDFAKQKDDNLAIYCRLDLLHRWRRPVLLPVSRKTVIGDVLGLPSPNERDAGTIACIAAGMQRGAHIFRVHNVRATFQAVKTLWAVTSC
jgi:dihydropteroate synthase